MKTLLTILLLTSFSTFSQRNFHSVTGGDFMTYYEYGWEYSQFKKNEEQYKENNIEKIETVKYSRKNKNKSLQYFDNKGRVIKIEHYYNEKKYSSEYSYDEVGNIVQLKNTNKKGITNQATYTYNKDNKILTIKGTNYKGNYYARTLTYNEEGKRISFLIYEKDREHPTKELHYTYYPEGSKKQTIYKVKGKTKYTWNFECSEEGEIVSEDKKETKICILKEQDKDGNTVTWTREFHKGELRKTKTTKTSDGKWINTQYYNEKDELVSESTQKEDGGVIRKTRNKKGEMVKQFESFLNKDGKTIKYIDYDKKWGYTRIYHYDGEFLISLVRVNRKHIYAEEYSYITRKI